MRNLRQKYFNGISEINGLLSTFTSFVKTTDEIGELGNIIIYYDIDKKGNVHPDIESYFNAKERKKFDYKVHVKIGMVYLEQFLDDKHDPVGFSKYKSCVDIINKMEGHELTIDFLSQFLDYLAIVVTCETKSLVDFIMVLKYKDRMDFLKKLDSPYATPEKVLGDSEMVFFQNEESKIDNSRFSFVKRISNHKMNGILGFDYVTF